MPIYGPRPRTGSRAVYWRNTPYNHGSYTYSYTSTMLEIVGERERANVEWGGCVKCESR